VGTNQIQVVPSFVIALKGLECITVAWHVCLCLCLCMMGSKKRNSYQLSVRRVSSNCLFITLTGPCARQLEHPPFASPVGGSEERSGQRCGSSPMRR